MPSYRFSLESAAGATASITVPPTATLASIAVEVHSGFDLDTAVATLQFQLDEALDAATGQNLATWRNVSPAVTFDASAAFQVNIPVAGLGRIRLKTTTADSSGDTDAYAVVIFR